MSCHVICVRLLSHPDVDVRVTDSILRDSSSPFFDPESILLIISNHLFELN